MKLEGYSGSMCNKHVHSTMTRSNRFHCLIGIITDYGPSYLYTDDLLWRNFLSPQCIAHVTLTTHSLITRLRLTRVQNLKSLALAVAEKLYGV